MALNARLELRQQQRLSLTPELRTRLALLRLSALDLEDEIARTAAGNPFLIFERPLAQPMPADAGAELLSAPDAGFQESLRRQIAAMDLPPGIAALATFLIGELREDGYLDADLDDLATETGATPGQLARSLAAVQACEPVGVGARSLAECLALQLADRGMPPAEAEATVTQLAAFARGDWAGAAAALAIPEAEVRARARLVRGLVPRPVAPRDTRQQDLLRPDLRLDRRPDGTLAIIPDDSHRPRLVLDQTLARRAEADGFAPDLLGKARALIEALELRGRTLERIGGWLASNQAAFFEFGVSGLKPASRSALAQDLGVHPSTVSRAVAGKAIDVDGRLWPLAVFFSAAVTSTDGPVAARAVQRRVAQLIAAEPASQPHSDETVAGLLRAEGVDIARRTVAKYRQGLRIPPTSARRRLAATRRGE